MKKLLLLLSIIFLFGTAAAQEYTSWKWLHETPQGNTLRWVKMWDANNWYAVGVNGTFMKTSDGGSTWYFHHKAGIVGADGGGATVYTANFTSMNNGIVVATGGVAYTVDGGVTFQQIAVQLPSAATWYNSYFINETIGYLAGTTSGRLAKTTDGGLSWTLNTIIPSGTYYDVWSPNDTLILVASTSGNIRRSTDGGLSFTQINVGHTGTNYKFAFKDADNGWVSGSTGKASYTTDGGATWVNASAGLPTATIFYDVDFRMDGTTEQVVLTGDSFNLYVTSDMGATWTQLAFLAPYADQPWTSTYYSTSFYNDKFVTVGANGLINSRTGTATPVIHSVFRKPGTLNDIWADFPGGRIIAVGAPGNPTAYDQIFYSSNGGTTWNKSVLNKMGGTGTVQFAEDNQNDELNNDMMSPTSTSTFRAIDMVNSNIGYVCGSNSAVYKTTNGGESWDSLTTPVATLGILYDIDFVTAEIGWFVGFGGNLYKTTDGGTTWIQQFPGTTGTIYSISMADPLVGCLTGASGFLSITSDGGTTWTPQTSGFGTSIIYSAKMVNAQVGYIVGATSKIAKTTNGGVTWEMLTLPAVIASTTLYTVDFWNEDYGLVGGSSGRSAVTTDGGLTWQVENASNGTIQAVRIAASGSDTTYVFCAGSNGSILVDRNFIVPVELTLFKADVIPAGVELNWHTSSEKNNSGFAIERMSDKSSFEQIAFIPGRGTTLEFNKYTYLDQDITSGKYSYRLKQIDYDGTYAYTNVIEVNISNPASYSLSQNYPNPFNPSTAITFEILSKEHVTLKIYDVLGNLIKEVIDGEKEAGRHTIYFNASDISSGVYFYELKAGSYSSVRKMMLMK
jgi:photosystem II stability/assembly factor-like uncharacterized protein